MGCPNPLADMDRGSPNPLADLDRGVQIRCDTGSLGAAPGAPRCREASPGGVLRNPRTPRCGFDRPAWV